MQNSATNKITIRLHDFLRSEREAILQDWERLVRQEFPVARDLSAKDLRNNLPTILDTIAERSERACGKGDIRELPKKGPKIHANQRWQVGFDLQELTREYGILRSVILRRMLPKVVSLTSDEVAFLHASLDDAIIEGVAMYVSQSNSVLKAERERLQVILRSIADGVISTDVEGKVDYLNPAAQAMTGWTNEQAVGRPVSEVLIALEEDTHQPLRSLTQIAAETGKPSAHPSEILLQDIDGNLLPAEENAAPLRDANGQFIGVVTTFRDVSKIRALTLQLGYLAAHDTLTGLPNRYLLMERLEQELAHAERNQDRLALLYLDLDRFKDVNDTLGHAAGDELLKQVSTRLQNCVRRTDTVCRLGGDEFVILLTEFGAIEYLSETGAKITRNIKIPYYLGTERVDISTSMGISVYPDDGQDAQTLIKHADIAMYQAKSQGRNDVRFFAPEMNRRANERRELQSDLRQALASNQLALHYQPQISLKTGEAVGAEVLLRWKHPKLGDVAPSRFIPIAEDSGEIMVDIGNWVLDHACRQARAWLDAGHEPVRLSVNVSLVQLRNPDFAAQIGDILARYQVPAETLQLELTESVLMSDIANAGDRVRALESLGIRIAVDDFGTGYSSLSYLKDLPVDELKIDQGFVHEINDDDNKAAIVQAVIRMGQSLNLRVIAEGIEDQDEVDFLTANGCEGGQGFYYSRALTPEVFEHRFLQ